MMKRLFLVLATLIAGSSLAAGNQTTFHFKFPEFAAVFTNVQDVYFFDDGNGNDGLGNAGALSPSNPTQKKTVDVDYYAATAAGVEQCILDNFTPSGTYIINGTTPGTLSQSCYFAPSHVGKSGFSVDGYDNVADSGYSAASPPTDGELLVITNAGNFEIGTSVDTSGGGVPASFTLEVYAGFVETNSSSYQLKSKASTTWKNLSTAYSITSSPSNPIFDETLAYGTQYSFAKVIPLLFRLNAPVLTSAITTEQTLVVTWDAAAQ